MMTIMNHGWSDNELEDDAATSPAAIRLSTLSTTHLFYVDAQILCDSFHPSPDARLGGACQGCPRP